MKTEGSSGPPSIKLLKQYRNSVFPSCLADANHLPYFSIEKPHEWVNSDALSFFRSKAESTGYDTAMNTMDAKWEEQAVTIIKSYRDFILPPEMAVHPFFELDNAENWISDSAFQLFLDSDLPKGEISTVKKEIERHGVKQEEIIELSASKKRKANTHEKEVIVISSDSDSVPSMKPVQPSQVIKKSKNSVGLNEAKISKSTRKVFVNLALSSESEEEPKAVVESTKRPTASRGKAAVKESKSRRSLRVVTKDKIIKVTKKEWVEEVKILSNIPAIWDVPRHPTAYMIDLSKDTHFEGKSIIHWIKHEEQSSWEGSSGHKAGDAKVIDLLGEQTTLCRRADFHCKGIKECEFLDQSLLHGFEGWERDDSEMEPFWQSELNGNEQEFKNPDGPLARFYNRIMESTCKMKCDGKPVICKLGTRSLYGKTLFIGCSKWRRQEKDQHRMLHIEKQLDELLVSEMMKNGGKLPDGRRKEHEGNGKCSLILHPRSHKKHCAFTHIVNGDVKRGVIRKHEPACNSRLIIFEPLDSTIRKAIVIPMLPHNHPRHPHAKPTLAEKEFVVAASKASGEMNISGKALRTSATTAALLQGESWESRVPGLVDSRRLGKYLKSISRENFPRGFDWEGVKFEAKREAESPLESRYIHTVTTKGDIRLVVTMNPRIAKFIHKARFLAIDYTFKRVRGEMNEWEVAGIIDRYKKRVTFASLYCNRANRDAFNTIFQEFFDVVRRLTGEKLTFVQLDPQASLGALLFDAEPAQMQGCGDNLLVMNDPSVSQITTKDPLQIVQFFAKTCVQHFYRNIDELSKSIPRDVINRLKSFPTLNSQTDIDDWNRFCKDSVHKDVANWYKQKLSHPWYLPSVNRFLSPMPKNIWDNTPDDSNIAETAHAARNAETKISRPILAAIFDARFRDEQIAEQLEYFEKNYLTMQRFNLPIDREKRSAARRKFKEKKTKLIGIARDRYEGLEAELRCLDEKRKNSLIKTGQITDRLESLKIELNGCSKLSMQAKGLQDEKGRLQKEIRKEIDDRNAWRAEASKCREEMKSLKNDELRNSRVRHSRPASRSSSVIAFEGADSESQSEVSHATALSTSEDEGPLYHDDTVPGLGSESDDDEFNIPRQTLDLDLVFADAIPPDLPAVENSMQDLEGPYDFTFTDDVIFDLEEQTAIDMLALQEASDAILDRFLELHPEDL